MQEVRNANQPSEGQTEVQSLSIWGGDATLWNKMLDLTYKGHVDLALQLFDTCWHSEWKDKDAAAKMFLEAGGGSHYGRAVVEAQGYELPEPEAAPEAVPAPKQVLTTTSALPVKDLFHLPRSVIGALAVLKRLTGRQGN